MTVNGLLSSIQLETLLSVAVLNILSQMHVHKVYACRFVLSYRITQFISLYGYQMSIQNSVQQNLTSNLSNSPAHSQTNEDITLFFSYCFLCCVNFSIFQFEFLFCNTSSLIESKLNLCALYPQLVTFRSPLNWVELNRTSAKAWSPQRCRKL